MNIHDPWNSLRETERDTYMESNNRLFSIETEQSAKKRGSAK